MHVQRRRGDIARLATTTVKKVDGPQNTEPAHPPWKTRYLWSITVSRILFCSNISNYNDSSRLGSYAESTTNNCRHIGWALCFYLQGQAI